MDTQRILKHSWVCFYGIVEQKNVTTFFDNYTSALCEEYLQMNLYGDSIGRILKKNKETSHCLKMIWPLQQQKWHNLVQEDNCHEQNIADN